MQRVYRSDRRCPHCGSNGRPQAGFSRGKQTYRCGECHHRHNPEGNRHYPPPQVKSQAWEMYGAGMSIAAISRALGLSELTVLAWIKKGRPAGDQPERGDLGVLRRKFNRLAQWTQGYSKSLAMLVDSLALVGLKPGWIQNACPCQEYRQKTPRLCLLPRCKWSRRRWTATLPGPANTLPCRRPSAERRWHPNRHSAGQLSRNRRRAVSCFSYPGCQGITPLACRKDPIIGSSCASIFRI